MQIKKANKVVNSLAGFCLSVCLIFVWDLSIAFSKDYFFRAETVALVLAELALVVALVAILRLGGWLVGKSLDLADHFGGSIWASSLFTAALYLSLSNIFRFPTLDVWIVYGVLAPTVYIAVRKNVGSKLQVVLNLLFFLFGLFFVVKQFSNPPQPGRSMLNLASSEKGQVATAEKPNLLLIMLDTMRADHLQAYGYERETSPWLQRFAAESLVFENVMSSSSYTLPAHATLFTGLFPAAHGADIVADGGGLSLEELGLLDDKAPVAPLSPEALTLAEIAKEAEIETGAICANSAYLYRAFGLNQGFDTYVDAQPLHPDFKPSALAVGYWLASKTNLAWRFRKWVESSERYYLLASEINVLAKEWLRAKKGQRFFLFLNYMDAHHPYLPLGNYENLFQGSKEQKIDSYDAEIRYLDDQLSDLFAEIQALDLMQNTLILFVGDHGESFGEHDVYGHAASVYQSEVHIPLIMRQPGLQHAGQRVGNVKHLVDVNPTILDLMGLPRPDSLQGISLFEQERQYPMVAHLGQYHRRRTEAAVFHGAWKLIKHEVPDFMDRKPRIELYDIFKDPAEVENIAEENQEIVKKLFEKVQNFEKKVKIRFKQSDTSNIDEETRKRLRSLGYMK